MTKEFNYNDIIEYIDCTYDENFEDAKHWAQEHNTTFEELIDRRDLPKRYFQIGEEQIIPEPLPPTKEEQEQNRANAYQQEVDPITCNINRLRDEEQTEEVIAEIEQLKLKRKAKVAEIKARYPYPIEETNISNSTLSENKSEGVI